MRERVERTKNFLKENRVSIISFVILFVLTFAVIIRLVSTENNKAEKSVKVNDPELARAMNYDRFEDGDEDIGGTNNVKFSAFFLRDVDGDGYADKIKGTCREVGTDDSLYMEIEVKDEGVLKNPKIEINGQNFYLAMSSPKDNEFKENYITSNAKIVEFNDFNAGTKKVFSGLVRSGDYTYSDLRMNAISNNINDMSRDDNKIVFSGTFVATDGTEIEINKEVNLSVDWYGTMKTEISAKNSAYYDLDSRIDTDNSKINLVATIQTDEIKNQLVISKNYVEGTIPQLNGYDPLEVSCSDANLKFSYDDTERKFVITKEATVDADREVTLSVPRNNVYSLNIVYPLEAYISMGVDSVQIQVPVLSYYEGFNNPNAEFTNPYKSDVVKDNLVYSFSRVLATENTISATVGKYVASPTNNYIISKDNILNAYKTTTDVVENDIYPVRWYMSRGTDEYDDGVVLAEQDDGGNKISDNFIFNNLSEGDMTNFVNNIGIAFSGADAFLNADGWIKVYDDDTDELLATFTKNNWSDYTEDSFYKYKLPVKHVRVETSKTNTSSAMYVYNIKEIDNEVLSNEYSEDQIISSRYIVSTVTAKIGTYANTVQGRAIYGVPYSIANLKISQNNFSTQTTEKNCEVNIEAQYQENCNENEWKNGKFLLQLPKGILIANINKISTSNDNVKIKNYEYYENDGVKFIKITTQNDVPQKYNIILNLDITPDPRISTTYDLIELWASNEVYGEYYNAGRDIYDINGDLDTTDMVAYDNADIVLNAPETLLTNQIATDYDKNGSLVVSPQIADVEASTDDDVDHTVKIGMQIKNNYSNIVSDIDLMGVVPFEGNRNILNNEDLHSAFSTEMLYGGIEIPEDLQGKVSVYYSENEKPSKDLSNTSNGWKTANEISDWYKIKSYWIDFGNTTIDSMAEYVFYYTVRIPAGTEFNKIAYSHYGIEFALNTPEGKYVMQTEPTKLGIRIVEKYKLEVTKYQEGSDKVLSGATYRVKGTTLGDIKTATTGADGKLVFDDLYTFQMYELSEVDAPENYEVNDTSIKFNMNVTDNGVHNLEIANAIEIGDNEFYSLEKVENRYVAKFKLEDRPKVKLNILKVQKDDENERISGIRYKLTGYGLPDEGVIGTTDGNGVLELNGVQIGQEYTLEETKASGYYLADPVVFKVNRTGSVYSVDFVSGKVKKNSITVDGGLPVLNVEIENEKIPSYNLEITKIKRNLDSSENVTYISGAKFRLFKGSKLIGEYETDANGKILINDLYKYVDGKQESGEYVLREVSVPLGYSKIKDITFRAKQVNDTLEFIEDLPEGKEPRKYTVEDNTLKLMIEDSPIFEISSVDGENNTPVASAKFAIYNVEGEETPALDSNGVIVGTKENIDGKDEYVVMSDELGKISVDLAEGLYVAREVQTSDMYDISDSEYYFGVGMHTDSINELQKLSVVHKRKEFKITTDVKEVCGTKGGTISGENDDVYEIVKYGDSSIKELRIVPNAGYELTEIAVNNQEIEFVSDADGSYVLPAFSNVQEDKNIVVTFVFTENKAIVNNIDSASKEAIVGSVFEFKQTESYEGNTEMFNVTAKANRLGKVITQLPFGKYEVRQISVPDEYFLNEDVKTIEFSQDGIKEFTIENDRKAKIIVHHYLKDSTVKVAEDEEYTAKVGDDYTTSPKVGLEEYELQRDDNNEFILPANSNGKYTNVAQEITYYYQERLPRVRVYHYILGTETLVPLQDGTRANAEEYVGKRGTTYVTSPLMDGVLSDNYEFVSATGNITGVFDERITNVIYYYKLKEFSYRVQYYYNGVYAEGQDEVMISPVGTTVDSYIDKVKDNYELINTENLPLVVSKDESKNIIKVYYGGLKTSVIVHYYEEGTTNKVSEDVIIDGRMYESYAIALPNDVDEKYELVAVPDNATGIMAKDTIEVVYYYRVRDAVVNVHYVEKTSGNQISEDVQLTGKVDEEYVSSSKTIDGYTLVGDSGNTSGKFKINPLEVSYYYAKNGKVIVQYIDKNTNDVLDEYTEVGKIGDMVTTESKNFNNYVLVQEPDSKVVTIIDGEITLKYYYAHVSAGVIEKHIDEATGMILDNIVHLGNEGDQYKITEKSFEGYDVDQDKLPINSEGVMGIDTIEVVYYYKYRSSVLVKYIDKITGNNMIEDVVISGYEGDNYFSENKVFDGYVLKTIPENANGKMTKSQIVVEYYYTQMAGGVVVSYEDVKSGKQLQDMVRIEGDKGAVYTTEAKNFDGYDLVTDMYPNNAQGIMDIETIKVTYYYIKKVNVNVRFIDKSTGRDLLTSTIISVHEGDSYKAESKDIDGFKLKEHPSNETGIVGDSDIEVQYYYLRPAKVIVSYIDSESGAKLLPDDEINGYQDDTYTTSAQEIQYLKVSTISGNAKGYMNVSVVQDENGQDIVDECTYVKYYYTKKLFDLDVGLMINSMSVNGKVININGNLAKADILKDQVFTADVRFVYTVTVKNVGELIGKGTVIEKIPTGMSMVKEDNPDWNISESTATIDTSDLKPGEEASYKLILRWENGEANLGNKINSVEVVGLESEAGFAETSSDNNISNVTMIVSIGTGENTYIIIASGIAAILMILAGGIYIIRKRIR